MYQITSGARLSFPTFIGSADFQIPQKNLKDIKGELEKVEGVWNQRSKAFLGDYLERRTPDGELVIRVFAKDSGFLFDLSLECPNANALGQQKMDHFIEVLKKVGATQVEQLPPGHDNY